MKYVLYCLSRLCFLGIALIIAQTARAEDIFIALGNLNRIVRYSDTGTYLGDFVTGNAQNPLNDPWNLTFGPNGDLYVTNYKGRDIQRYDGLTGSFLGVVASGLSAPVDIAFSKSGRLFVTEVEGNQVDEIDPTTGARLKTYGGFQSPYGLAFRPNGDLLISALNGVQNLNIDTGVMTLFSSTPANCIAAGPDDRYYVTNFSDQNIKVISSGGGSAALWANVGTGSPAYMAFSSGSLYVTVLDGVRRYDQTTGAYQGFIATGDINTTGITVRPTVTAAAPEPGTFGMMAFGALSLAGIVTRRRRAR